jgi:pyruvate kinase
LRLGKAYLLLQNYSPQMSESLEVQCLSEISRLIARAEASAEEHVEELAAVNPTHLTSAKNLLHYAELRKSDLRELQQRLGTLGLSRLARAEEHVIPSLRQVESILKRLLFSTIEDKDPTIKEKTLFESLLETHAAKTLGPAPVGRRARIMVTMPASAASDQNQIKRMIRAGMNVARINCAHDGPQVWFDIIQNIRSASTDLHQPVKIIMDLAGPKLRTQINTKSSEVIKVKPVKNELGQVVAAREVPLTINNETQQSDVIPLSINVEPEHLINQTVWLKDARGKKRSFDIRKKNGQLYGVFAKTTYLLSGQAFHRLGNKTDAGNIGRLPKQPAYIYLSQGDHVLLTKENQYYEESHGHEKSVACTFPAAIDAIQTGEHVFFDDGKIGGTVISRLPDSALIEITQTLKPSTKLKSEKGINLPDTALPVTSLSAKDKEDLQFIGKYADGVHLSFISQPSDVLEVIEILKKAGVAQDFSLILKIENKSSFRRLKEIILSALRWQTVGVMIARGDLAIETGWENIGRIQKEIIKMSNAAHIPVIWATQVLDNLAKNGFPSRSEVTDAATSNRADCVMLNKGPHIIKAIEFLDQLLTETELYQKKNVAMLPKMMELK